MTETEHPNKWQAAGAAVVARRAALGMQQADLVRASRVSDLTIRQFERGEGANMRPTTRQRIALALGWPPDAFDGDTLPAVSDPAIQPTRSVADLEQEVGELRAEVARLAVLAESHTVLLSRIVEGESPTTRSKLKSAVRHLPAKP